jgi:hypothetical protein
LAGCFGSVDRRGSLTRHELITEARDSNLMPRHAETMGMNHRRYRVQGEKYEKTTSRMPLAPFRIGSLF